MSGQQRHWTVSNDTKQLLDEVKSLHEQRLRWVALDTTATREQLLQMKEDFLQSYVNDLTDQNQLLLQTIEELQTGADPLSKSGLIQPRTSLELSRHLQHLRSDISSITQLIHQTGQMHSIDDYTWHKNTAILRTLTNRSILKVCTAPS